jgi:hypothetical protein
MKTMDFVEAVPNFKQQVAKSDVLSQKTQKTQIPRTLENALGPSLLRVRRIWVFWVFWDSTPFLHIFYENR